METLKSYQNWDWTLLSVLLAQESEVNLFFFFTSNLAASAKAGVLAWERLVVCHKCTHATEKKTERRGHLWSKFWFGQLASCADHFGKCLNLTFWRTRHLDRDHQRDSFQSAIPSDFPDRILVCKRRWNQTSLFPTNLSCVWVEIRAWRKHRNKDG